MHSAIRVRSLVLAAAAIALTASAASAIGPLQLYSTTPCRIVDTRWQPPGTNRAPSLVNMGTRSFQVTGVCGVPSTAKAAVLNVTIAEPTHSGYLIVYPYNTSRPLASNINWAATEYALANGAITPMTFGSLNISVFSELYGAPSGGGAVNVILDVTGYFDCPPGTNPNTCQ
jgi:hypothetical protein